MPQKQPNPTPGYRYVLYGAKVAASEFGSDFINPEHYLIAMLRRGNGLALSALKACEVDVQALLKSLIDLAREKSSSLEKNSLYIPSEESRRIMESARQLCLDRNENHIGTEHLLLAMIKEPNTGLNEILAEYKIDYDRIEAVVDSSKNRFKAKPQQDSSEPKNQDPFDVLNNVLRDAIRENLHKVGENENEDSDEESDNENSNADNSSEQGENEDASDPRARRLGRPPRMEGARRNKKLLSQFSRDLTKLAADHGAAVVMVTHLSKASSARAIYRAMGSLAFIAAVRSAWAVTSDKDHPERRLFLPVKNNLAPDGGGLAFAITDGRVTWESAPVTMRADEALELGNGDHRPGPKPEARNAAAAWLAELLADGPMPVAQIQDEAKAAGYSWTTTMYRAKDQLRVKPRKAPQFGGGWVWALPEAPAG